MNKTKPPKASGGASGINTTSDEKMAKNRRSNSVRFSKSMLIAKRSSYFEEQTIEGDMDSSVSSYGSFTRDEEIFSRLIK